MTATEHRLEPLELARLLHRLAAQGRAGVLQVPGQGARSTPARLALAGGFVHAIDVGPSAPVSSDAQIRYILRLRSVGEFLDGQKLSGKYAVEPLRPDSGIRQHLDAQSLPTEVLRQRLGSARFVVFSPPHSSSLHPEERSLIAFLSEPRTVPELLLVRDWSPLRAMKLLSILDALGCLHLGGSSQQLAEAWGLLELQPGASADDIKHAYRRLVRMLHPDHHQSAAPEVQRALVERFSAVHTAYKLLLSSR
jgi:hypothetical protein